MRNRADLRRLLANNGVDVENPSYRFDIQQRSWEIVDDQGTLGGWHIEAYRNSDDKFLTITVHKESDDEDLGRDHAAMELLARIIELETHERR